MIDFYVRMSMLKRHKQFVECAIVWIALINSNKFVMSSANSSALYLCSSHTNVVQLSLFLFSSNYVHSHSEFVSTESIKFQFFFFDSESTVMFSISKSIKLTFINVNGKRKLIALFNAQKYRWTLSIYMSIDTRPRQYNIQPPNIRCDTSWLMRGWRWRN